MLKAGLDGIKKRINPPAAVNQNIYAMRPEEKADLGIGSLPGSLVEALEELKHDEVIQCALGKHAYSRFMEAKQLEWNDFRTKVTPWEIEQYLTKF
jgi:glutamine synthetase